jgi:N-acetylmuramoyl-L-alanine amidase
MKVKIIISLITITLIIPTLLVVNNVKAETIHKQEIKQLLTVNDEQNEYQSKDNQQFVIVKTYDNTNLTRKTIINPKDYIDKIKNRLNKNAPSQNIGLLSNNSNNNNSNSNKIINSSSDVLLLAHLIESEAGDEPFEGKLAVASVVLNREKVDNQSLSDVIFEKNQFDGVTTKNFTITPCADSIKAAQEVLGGTNIVSDAYYFADLKLCSPDFAQSSTFITRIGDHWFFRK